MATRDDQLVEGQGTGLGILARLWWMFIGNIVLAFSLLFIAESRDGFFHTADGVFWITVISLVLVRYADIKYLHGATATGTPASMRNWTRYAAGLIVISILAWALAHAVNYAFITRTAQG